MKRPLLFSLALMFIFADATKPGPGSIPTPSHNELQRLYAVASEWQVGTPENIKRIDEARNQLIGIGLPALQFMLDEKWDTGDSLQTRAFEGVVYGIGEPAFDPLIAKLSDTHTYSLRNTVNILGNLAVQLKKTDRVEGPIAALLDRTDLSVLVLRNVLRTLGTINSKVSVPRIIPFLSHKNELVVISACVALGQIKGDSSIGPLLDRIGDGIFTKRIAAADALVSIGEKSGGLALDRLSNTSDTIALNHLIRVLGQIKYAPALPTLERLMGNASDWSVRGFAAEALGATADPSALPALNHARETEKIPFVKGKIDAAVSALQAAGKITQSAPRKVAPIP
ncbi:MAG: HEAT repeat domain-containing protein [bacterium]